jgi:hypothetical protein
LFGGLETQTRPVYEARSILNRGFEPGLLDHELAHMWFGDNVTVRQWNDIFTTEGYASWAQWGASELTGGRKANDALNRAYDRLKDNDAFWKITMIDPGKSHLFDAVYVRGPDGAAGVTQRDWGPGILLAGQGLGSRSRESHARGVDGRSPGAHHN